MSDVTVCAAGHSSIDGCTCDPGPAFDWSEYEDDIADAIDDSLDMDWTSRDGAKAVVRLLNELRYAPAPAIAKALGEGQ